MFKFILFFWANSQSNSLEFPFSLNSDQICIPVYTAAVRFITCLSAPLLQKDEVYLNLVLDYVPETVYRVARHFNKAKATIPIIYVKVGRQTHTYTLFKV